MAVIDFPADRLAIAQSLERVVESISEWCAASGMKSNADKIKTIIFRGHVLLSPCHHFYPQQCNFTGI